MTHTTIRSITYCLLFSILCFLCTTLHGAQSIETILKNANELLTAEDYHRALAEFKHAHSINAYDPRVYDGLARVFIQLGRTDDADTHFKKAIQIDSSSTVFRLHYGYFLIAMARYDNAQTQFNTILSYEIHNPDALVGIGRIRLARGNYREARHWCTEALKFDAAHTGALRQLGEIAFDLEEWDIAQKYFTRAYQIDPTDADVLFYRARLAERQGDMERAAGFYRQAVDRDPNNADKQHQLYLFYERHNRWNDALETLAAVTEKAKDNFRAHYMYAYALLQAGQTKNAMHEFETCLQLNSGDEFARYSLENVYIKTQSFYYPPRIAAAQEHLKKGNRAWQRGHTFEGLWEMRRGLQLNGQNAEARYRLSKLYQDMSLYVSYIHELEIAQKLDPSVSLYHNELAHAADTQQHRLAVQSDIDQYSINRAATRLYIAPLQPTVYMNTHINGGNLLTDMLQNCFYQLGRITVPQPDEVIQALHAAHLTAVQSRADALAVAAHLDADYVLWGRYIEYNNELQLILHLTSLHTFADVHHYQLHGEGNGKVHTVMIELADALYRDIPYHGEIIQHDEWDILVNMGTVHDIQKGQTLEIFRGNFFQNSIQPIATAQVVEVDELICKARLSTYAAQNTIRLHDSVRFLPEDNNRTEQ